MCFKIQVSVEFQFKWSSYEKLLVASKHIKDTIMYSSSENATHNHLLMILQTSIKLQWVKMIYYTDTDSFKVTIFALVPLAERQKKVVI